MLNLQTDFRRYVCQTSDSPIGLEIVRGDGPFVFTADGQKYLDLISGIGVVNVGHNRREIVQAIQKQATQYLHPMVYGEFVMQPQVEYAKKLAAHLPGDIENIFFTNSGAEAVEGTLKTARKFTGRQKIYSFSDCYHGDTMGALSLQSAAVYRKPFEPVVPEIASLTWNDIAALDDIDTHTAGVIIEPVQGEAGVRVPDQAFMEALRQKCDASGALLIFDEVMTGFGRTGKLFAAEHFGIVPDIIVLAKALGGGLPLGAFAARKEVMAALSSDPPLAHVTTFGGNPVCCAAGLASFELMLRDDLPARAVWVGEQFIQHLNALQQRFACLREIRAKGCLIGIEFDSSERAMTFCRLCLQQNVIVGWTLFHSNVVRMAPPLILECSEIDRAAGVMAAALQEICVLT